MVWIKLILCILIIFFFGKNVAKYGDIIAWKTGLGRAWVGLVLLALLTSLPELFTGISAVTLIDAPDLTIGNLFGANAFNLLNLALLDIAYRNGPLFRALSPSHRLPAWFSLSMVSIATASVFISQFSSLGIGWIGWYTPLIILLYLIFMRAIFRFEQSQPLSKEAEHDYGEISSKNTYLYFAISAAVIIGAGLWLAMLGEEVAQVTRWRESFVGSLLIGFITTLPEISVSFAAMRMGALDMAVANMIGSNLFNMVIICIDDLLYLNGPVLATVSKGQLITGLTVIAMTGIFIAGLRFRSATFIRLSWHNSALIVLFLLGAYFSFIFK